MMNNGIRKARRSTSKTRSHLLDLPTEILDEIFLKLDLKSLQDVEYTCKSLQRRVKIFRRTYRDHIRSLKPSSLTQKGKQKVASSVSGDSENRQTSRNGFKYRFIIFSLFIILLACIYNKMSFDSIKDENSSRRRDITINFENLEKINQLYPGLLTTKKMRIIKTRISVMLNEVSVLMLLGRSRDSHCKYDPTFCIGKTIANVTQLQYSYIDASNPYLNPAEVQQELWQSLDGTGISVMIDSLEKLPGSEVMNLFQFIDKDATHQRRGMLLFIVYTGSELDTDYSQLKEADIAERILVKRWSKAVPKDSLTSLLSRMCGSIVKVY